VTETLRQLAHLGYGQQHLLREAAGAASPDHVVTDCEIVDIRAHRGDRAAHLAADDEWRFSTELVAVLDHQRVGKGDRGGPDLDDDFARALGEYDSLDALRERVTADLGARAERETDRRMRDDLLVQLAARLPGEVPEALVTREIDRRVERLASQLVAQRVDPRRAGIDWEEFRASQRNPAVGTVKSTLVLDEVARRESIEATESDIDTQVERLAARSNRGAPAMRALLEKEGGVASLAVGIRREKTIDFLLAHATIVTA
jgi:trigger factor